MPATDPPGTGDALDGPVSRRRAALWSMVANYAALGLSVVRNIALVPLYVTRIEGGDYAAWLASGGVVAQLTSVDFGLLGVLVQQVAEAYGARDRRRLESLIGTGLVLAAGLSVALAGLIAAATPVVTTLLDLDAGTASRVRAGLLVVAAANALQLLAFALGGVLQSLQRTIVPGAARVAAEVAALGLTAALVLRGWGVMGIAAGVAARAALELAVDAIGVLGVVRGRLALRPAWDATRIAGLWRQSTFQFLTQIAARIKSSADPFVVGVVLGTGPAAAWALTFRAHDTVRLFGASLGAAMTPALAHLHGEGRRGRFAAVATTAVRLQALTAAIGLGGVAAFNGAFVRLWAGPEFYAGDATSILGALWIALLLVSTVPYDCLFAMGRFSTLARIVWLETAGRLLLLVVGLRLGGLGGAVIGVLVAQAALASLPLFTRLVREIGLSRANVVELGGRVLRLAAPAALLAAGFRLAAPGPSSVARLAIEGAVFVALALAATLFLDRSLWHELLPSAGSRRTLKAP